MRPYAIASTVLFIAGGLLLSTPAAASLLYSDYERAPAELHTFFITGAGLVVLALVVAIRGFIKSILDE